jgi:hypothetical protein
MHACPAQWVEVSPQSGSVIICSFYSYPAPGLEKINHPKQTLVVEKIISVE